MRYDMMLPHQIRAAIADNFPVVLPLGVMEYHGEHMAVGMDTLAVTRALDILEQEDGSRLVILPPFAYGAASYAVEPPEGNGSLHIDTGILQPLAKSLFTGFLRVGFRNIHVFIHHQTENFSVGMPTDLAFKSGARDAIFAFLEKGRGEGWWGNAAMADYYAQQAGGGDPFNWIKLHPLMTAATIAEYPFDHAGEGETALMLSMCPEAVDMSRLPDGRWYTQSALLANKVTGDRGRDLILAHMRKVLWPSKPSSA